MSLELLSRTLVPLDGSEKAEVILSHLRRILPRHESRLILFHATPITPWIEEQDMAKYLRRVAFQLTNDGYPSTYITRTGPAAESILEAASTEGGSPIALTSHGRSG